MAGIYIHIPWCRKVCVYCDFHFSVSIKNRKKMVESLCDEIYMQRDFTGDEIIETIYFGGGTPSVLYPVELQAILRTVYRWFRVSESAEVTLEANPDDLTMQYLRDIKDSGIDRLSIGIESFFDEDLKWMNRRHNSGQSVMALVNSVKAGFKNINIDLIYGLPGLGDERWKENLDIAFEHHIQHLSSYFLTLEPKTVYSYRVKRGIMKRPDEKGGIRQYEILLKRAEEAGFIHYEISNFAKPNYFSKHNTSYWLQKPYLGIGPSANSFNGVSRQWNIRNNTKYIESISKGLIPCTVEKLDKQQRYNEYLLTSLRTIWGVDTTFIDRQFGKEYLNYFLSGAGSFIQSGMLEDNGSVIRLTDKGKLFADGIISDLFKVV